MGTLNILFHYNHFLCKIAKYLKSFKNFVSEYINNIGLKSINCQNLYWCEIFRINDLSLSKKKNELFWHEHQHKLVNYYLPPKIDNSILGADINDSIKAFHTKVMQNCLLWLLSVNDLISILFMLRTSISLFLQKRWINVSKQEFYPLSLVSWSHSLRIFSDLMTLTISWYFIYCSFDEVKWNGKLRY